MADNTRNGGGVTSKVDGGEAKDAKRNPTSRQSATVARRRAAARSRTKADAAERLQAADRALAKALPARAVDVIVKDAENAVALLEAKAPRQSAVTGAAVSARDVAVAKRSNLMRAFAERRDLLRDALSARDVAEMLGVSRQTPHDRANAGSLLAVKDNGKLVFPAWQFDPEGPDGVLDGLPDALREMRGPISSLGRVKWFLTPKRLLAGRTPLEVLREGAIDEVVAEARSIGAS